MTLTQGSFVRVHKDNDFRPGKDGLVMQDMGDEVGLFFGVDRHNEFQNVICVGTELWSKSELDLSTVD